MAKSCSVRIGCLSFYVEGRGRLLHEDPGLRRPVTLAYAHPGDLVGWAGLVRRSPCEWITAATPLKLVGFTASDFRLLEAEDESFRTWLNLASSPAELMDTFLPALRNRPVAEPAEREVMRQLVPGSHREASQLRHLPDDGAIWSGILAGPLPIGMSVDQNRLAQIPIGDPLRLIRVEKGLWATLMEPDLQAPEKSQLPMICPVLVIAIPICCLLLKGKRYFHSSFQARIKDLNSAKLCQLLLEPVHSVKLWPAWRCWHAITMFRSGGM